MTPGWSEAYGLFTKGEAPMVLSYTTSPAYHMVAENTERYQAAAFREGHYLQIEVAGPDRGLAGKGAGAEVPGLHDDARLSGSDPDHQLDVPGRANHRRRCPTPSASW